MLEIGYASQLWRYPVSSLGGEAMLAANVGEDGIAGDRLFGLTDRATGEIARPDSRPRWHAAPRIGARLLDEGRLQVAHGEGWLSAPSLEADAAISAFLGFDCTLLPYDMSATTGGLRPRYDKSPIHLLTSASLARLKALHPTGTVDPRRFRPNILVQIPAEDGSFPETEWIGRRIVIGEVELRITEPCRRCGFTIIAQDGVDRDPEILRTLVRHNAHNLGVYCTVERAGRIAAGDPVRLW